MKRQPTKSKQPPVQKSSKKEPVQETSTEEKFDPTPYLQKGANDQEIISMKECFDLFDKDKSGYIDLKEMKALIEEMSLESNPHKILELTHNLDVNQDNKIDFQEFLNLLNFYDLDHENEEELNKIFNKVSEDKAAFNVEDLKRIAKLADETFTEVQFENMIKMADRDGDNALNFEEFKNVIFKMQGK